MALSTKRLDRPRRGDWYNKTCVSYPNTSVIISSSSAYPNTSVDSAIILLHYVFLSGRQKASTDLRYTTTDSYSVVLLGLTSLPSLAEMAARMKDLYAFMEAIR